MEQLRSTFSLQNSRNKDPGTQERPESNQKRSSNNNTMRKSDYGHEGQKSGNEAKRDESGSVTRDIKSPIRKGRNLLNNHTESNTNSTRFQHFPGFIAETKATILTGEQRDVLESKFKRRTIESRVEGRTLTPGVVKDPKTSSLHLRGESYDCRINSSQIEDIINDHSADHSDPQASTILGDDKIPLTGEKPTPYGLNKDKYGTSRPSARQNQLLDNEITIINRNSKPISGRDLMANPPSSQLLTGIRQGSQEVGIHSSDQAFQNQLLKQAHQYGGTTSWPAFPLLTEEQLGVLSQNPAMFNIGMLNQEALVLSTAQGISNLSDPHHNTLSIESSLFGQPIGKLSHEMAMQITVLNMQQQQRLQQIQQELQKRFYAESSGRAPDSKKKRPQSHYIGRRGCGAESLIVKRKLTAYELRKQDESMKQQVIKDRIQSATGVAQRQSLQRGNSALRSTTTKIHKTQKSSSMSMAFASRPATAGTKTFKSTGKDFHQNTDLMRGSLNSRDKNEIFMLNQLLKSEESVYGLAIKAHAERGLSLTNEGVRTLSRSINFKARDSIVTETGSDHLNHPESFDKKVSIGSMKNIEKQVVLHEIEEIENKVISQEILNDFSSKSKEEPKPHVSSPKVPQEMVANSSENQLRSSVCKSINRYSTMAKRSQERRTIDQKNVLKQHHSKFYPKMHLLGQREDIGQNQANRNFRPSKATQSILYTRADGEEMDMSFHIDLVRKRSIPQASLILNQRNFNLPMEEQMAMLNDINFQHNMGPTNEMVRYTKKNTGVSGSSPMSQKMRSLEAKPLKCKSMKAIFAQNNILQDEQNMKVGLANLNLNLKNDIVFSNQVPVGQRMYKNQASGSNLHRRSGSAFNMSSRPASNISRDAKDDIEASYQDFKHIIENPSQVLANRSPKSSRLGSASAKRHKKFDSTAGLLEKKISEVNNSKSTALKPPLASLIPQDKFLDVIDSKKESTFEDQKTFLIGHKDSLESFQQIEGPQLISQDTSNGTYPAQSPKPKREAGTGIGLRERFLSPNVEDAIVIGRGINLQVVIRDNEYAPLINTDIIASIKSAKAIHQESFQSNLSPDSDKKKRLTSIQSRGIIPLNDHIQSVLSNLGQEDIQEPVKISDKTHLVLLQPLRITQTKTARISGEESKFVPSIKKDNSGRDVIASHFVESSNVKVPSSILTTIINSYDQKYVEIPQELESAFSGSIKKQPQNLQKLDELIHSIKASSRPYEEQKSFVTQDDEIPRKSSQDSSTLHLTMHEIKEVEDYQNEIIYKLPQSNSLIYSDINSKEFKRTDPVYTRADSRERRMQLESQALKLSDEPQHRPRSALIGKKKGEYTQTDIFTGQLALETSSKHDSLNLGTSFAVKRYQHKSTAQMLSKCLGDGSQNYQRQIQIVSATNNEAVLTQLAGYSLYDAIDPLEKRSQGLPIKKALGYLPESQYQNPTFLTEEYRGTFLSVGRQGIQGEDNLRKMESVQTVALDDQNGSKQCIGKSSQEGTIYKSYGLDNLAPVINIKDSFDSKNPDFSIVADLQVKEILLQKAMIHRIKKQQVVHKHRENKYFSKAHKHLQKSSANQSYEVTSRALIAKSPSAQGFKTLQDLNVTNLREFTHPKQTRNEDQLNYKKTTEKEEMIQRPHIVQRPQTAKEVRSTAQLQRQSQKLCMLIDDSRVTAVSINGKLGRSSTRALTSAPGPRPKIEQNPTSTADPEDQKRAHLRALSSLKSKTELRKLLNKKKDLGSLFAEPLLDIRSFTSKNEAKVIRRVNGVPQMGSNASVAFIPLRHDSIKHLNLLNHSSISSIQPPMTTYTKSVGSLGRRNLRSALKPFKPYEPASQSRTLLIGKGRPVQSKVYNNLRICKAGNHDKIISKLARMQDAIGELDLSALKADMGLEQ